MKTPDNVIISFLGALVITTIINAVLWQYVASDLYDCTDDAIPGYLTPGDWVHSFDGRSAMSVPHIVHQRDMSEPDTIKQGWTVGRLFGLWFVFFTASILLSLAAALVPSRSRVKV